MNLAVCYLLETTELSGGVRVVFDQARSLIERGHHVSIRALRGSHAWYPYPVNVDYVNDLSQKKPHEHFDVAIGTFWTTLDAARTLDTHVAIHLCQGCEWMFPEFSASHQAIEKVYRYPVAKMTVSDWLVEAIQKHIGSDLFSIVNVGQSVDTELYRPRGFLDKIRRARVKRIPVILVSGLYQSWVKGIATALDAVTILRRDGMKLNLIRVSNMPVSDVEHRHTLIDHYYESVTPKEMSDIYKNADICLSPSRSPEGFGLPFAEALSCGIPTVASSIPSYLSFDTRHDYACFVKEGDSRAMANGIKKVLEDNPLAKRLKKRGRDVARSQFNRQDVAERIEKFLFHQLDSQRKEP